MFPKRAIVNPNFMLGKGLAIAAMISSSGQFITANWKVPYPPPFITNIEHRYSSLSARPLERYITSCCRSLFRMVSPPRNPGAGSPPYPNPLALPQSKKRTSSGLSISSNMPSAKRRKSTLHSIASTPGGSHPLRQTSFPPEESARDPSVVRSPSVDSDTTAATGARSIATTATALKGKRGRKRKAEGSIISGKNAVRPSVEGNSAKGGGDDAEEEEDDEDGELGLVNQGEVVDKDTEKENMASVSPTIILFVPL